MLHEIRYLAPTGTPGTGPLAEAAAALRDGPLAGLQPAPDVTPATGNGLAAVVLHAALGGDVAPLVAWLDAAATGAGDTPVVLDTSAGLPLLPGAHLDAAAIDSLADTVRDDGLAVRVPLDRSEGSGDPQDPPQAVVVGVSLYEALGRDDVRLLLARLVHLFAPGLPCLSAEALVSMPPGDSTPAAGLPAADTDPLGPLMRRPVVQAVLTLVRLRQEHPAFAGSFECGPGGLPGVGGATAAPEGACLTAAELRALLGGAAEARRRADDPLIAADHVVELRDGHTPTDSAPDGALWMRWTSGPHQVVLQIVPAQGAFRLALTAGDGWACARSVREVCRLETVAA